MNKYEGIFIIKSDLNEDSVKSLLDLIQNEIKKNKGVIDEVKSWGKKILAYSIKKFNEGLYYQVDFTIETSALKDIERKFRLNDNILRLMVIKKER